MPKTSRIAILAYGSLLYKPGLELETATIECRPTVTPFRIEYARSSGRRADAPTLVPHEDGGYSKAQLLVLRQDIPLDLAKSILWRRETGKTGEYQRPTEVGPNNVIPEELHGFEGFDTVLYTQLGSNIHPLSAERLAELAIASAKSPNVDPQDNGIAYLLQARDLGVRTPLSEGYEAAILRLSGTNSLVEALDSAIRASHL